MIVGEPRLTEILQQVKDTLDTAECGLHMVLSADPSLRLIGLRNLIVFGRAVTNVLQKLRSVATEFDAWYQPWVERMRADPIMAYFYKLRSEILKEGRLPTSPLTHVTVMNFGALLAAVPKPPRAKAFFIGDRSGGSGWEVELPNDETQKFYVQLPQGIPGVEITVNFCLAVAPEEFRKVPVPDLAQHYFAQLKEMYGEARQRFKES
jgi:hypothetical protein